MQKLIQRTRVAERVVVRRHKMDAKVQAKRDKVRRIRAESDAHNELTRNIHDARKARTDAWELGPLTPKLDLGVNRYGIMESVQRRAPAHALRPHEIAARCAWAGTPQYLNLVPGDRVAVMEGSERGKIDEVKSIDMDTATLELKNISYTRVAVPDFMSDEDFQAQAAPVRIPISAVRLVHPIKDPKTGSIRDVIIEKLARSKVKWDRHTGYRTWRRFIPGLNITIPWPPREAVERKDTDADTPRAEVVAQTFIPTLLQPPMPEALIDELRNRYSRFRTRHEPLYVARKEREEELKREEKLSVATMRTPVQEYNSQQRALRRARGQPQLTDEMLKRIGEVIAKNKAAALSAAGAEEVASAIDPSAPPRGSGLDTQPLPPR